MNNPQRTIIDNIEYKINTDFRIAIECNKIAQNEDVGDYERALAIIYKLFGEKGLEHTEHHNRLLEIAIKYLRCGEEKIEEQEPDMDFEQDYKYIESSFMYDYHIDLEKETIHWWTFMNLMNGLSNSELGNCCILNKIRNIRNYDISEIKDNKTLNNILKAKEQFALKKRTKKMNEEQQKNNDKFNNMLGL